LIVLAHRFCRRKAVHAGHGQVHQDYIWLIAIRVLDRDLPVFRFKDDETVVFKGEAKEEARVFEVFDEQYFQIF
jgi:hypothetical protein